MAPIDIDSLPLDDPATYALLQVARPRRCSSSNRAA
jgi:hypothetical protein